MKPMLAAIMKAAKSKGRGGDTDIVHVNPQEKALLKHLGGAGTINPDTGLEEYKYGGAGTSEGMNDREGTFGGKDSGGGTNSDRNDAADAIGGIFDKKGSFAGFSGTGQTTTTKNDAAAFGNQGSFTKDATGGKLGDLGGQVNTVENTQVPFWRDAQSVPNPTPSYDMTMNNAAMLGGMIAGQALMPGAGVGLGPLAGEITGLGMQFDSPTGETLGYEHTDHAPGADIGPRSDGAGGEITSEWDRNNNVAPPVQAPQETQAKPLDPWLYPEDADWAAATDDSGQLSDEERRRRGNGSVMVLGRGGLAI